jgi:ActD protein
MDDVAAGARSRSMVAVFDDRGRLLDAIRRLRASGLEPETAFAPAYDEELIELIGRRSNAIGTAALAGAVLGCVAGFALTMWTTAQWPGLIVGGKPHLSMPPVLLIVFELTVLLASLAAAAAFLWRAAISRPEEASGTNPDFTDARFGLLICVDPVQTARAIETVRQAGAVECRDV